MKPCRRLASTKPRPSLRRAIASGRGGRDAGAGHRRVWLAPHARYRAGENASATSPHGGGTQSGPLCGVGAGRALGSHAYVSFCRLGSHMNREFSNSVSAWPGAGEFTASAGVSQCRVVRFRSKAIDKVENCLHRWRRCSARFNWMSSHTPPHSICRSCSSPRRAVAGFLQPPLAVTPLPWTRRYLQVSCDS